jgi:hypothetical protein
MVRKVKVVEVSFDGAPTNIVEENEAPEESNITTIEEESNPTPDEAYVETTAEPLVETPVETTAEPVVMKKKRSPPKAKAKAAAAATPPGLEEPQEAEAPEVEIAVEEIKIADAVPTKKPRAKAKPRAKPTPQPTHDADEVRIPRNSKLNEVEVRIPRNSKLNEVEVPPQGPAPPSRAPPIKYESPDEFWNNTIKNMKEKKKKQYEQLAAQAF